MARSLDDLMQVAGELSDEDCNTVLAFARFLRERSGPREPEETDPVAIPRPDDETVINAISRLTAGMFSKSKYAELTRTRTPFRSIFGASVAGSP